MPDPVIDTLVKELGFRVDEHQLVNFRYEPTGKGDEYKWRPVSAKPVTLGETALWNALLNARRALAGTAEELGKIEAERDKLLQGKAVSPATRPGPSHGEEAEPRRG